MCANPCAETPPSRQSDPRLPALGWLFLAQPVLFDTVLLLVTPLPLTLPPPRPAPLLWAQFFRAQHGQRCGARRLWLTGAGRRGAAAQGAALLINNLSRERSYPLYW
jgi:hypothetical protein